MNYRSSRLKSWIDFRMPLVLDSSLPLRRSSSSFLTTGRVRQSSENSALKVANVSSSIPYSNPYLKGIICGPSHAHEQPG